MNYDHILIRYGEISTKGKNRKRFIDQLKHNLKLVLTAFPVLGFSSNRDRLYIKLNGENHEKILEKLSNVFGIHSFSLALKCKSELEEIKNSSLQLMTEKYKPGNTFKVSARRADKTFPLLTNEINYAIGSHILQNTDGLTVDVHDPDIDLRVEVRSEGTYLTCKDYQGAGGLPAGVSGKAVLMLSGGIDSPVAGYYAMKRGIEVDAIHFFSPPYTSERAKQKVIDLARKLTALGGQVNLHIVPFTEIQETIQKQVPESYIMTSTRRMMLKIADRIRERQGGLAIITGESLGQVASQTLESMFAINDVTSTPIIRPLITFDKTDIISISKEIGTHDISILPYEDCCTIFTPASPATKPKLEKAERFESFLDFDLLLDKAVEQTEIIKISTSDNQDYERLF
ncbi:tRNA uracil 4-sulfurtransferase ThiI [Metabacillus idriensis]|uniref:tRNA uracil 4-sulfurtransferase ThiI n=1 Tax=Metabacillus idriensis TaxID=324768 RepID=UPI001639AC33|nr:tRNA uracil 4-sulfurtransferase ThiI [Metabacillus idriensis]QNG60924.1 tRNA 4-thiouridine(8) synthase ThiI [Bacillus sp. PAMC26568]